MYLQIQHKTIITTIYTRYMYLQIQHKTIITTIYTRYMYLQIQHKTIIKQEALNIANPWREHILLQAC